MGISVVRRNRTFAKVLTMVLAFCMIFGSLPAARISAAETNEGSVVQMPNLVRNPGFEDGMYNWSSRGAYPTGVIDDTVSYAGGKSLKMTLYDETLTDSSKRSYQDQMVPVNGGATYILRAYCKTEGRQGDSFIDAYFYKGTNVDKDNVGTYKSIKIDKGTADWKLYELTLDIPADAKYVRISPFAIRGTGSVWYDEISLTKVVGPNDLAYITVKADKTDLTVGEIVCLNIQGTLGNAWPADLSAATITYSSDNVNIASVDNGKVSAVGAGIANIKVSVTLNGITECVNIPFEVFGTIRFVKYDFKKGITSTIEKNGWRVLGSDAPSYRDQAYGIQVQSDKDQYITFEIDVPTAGYFTPKFTGASSGGGAVADIMLDNIFIGQTDFYSAATIYDTPPVLLKTLLLEEGIHKFTLKAVDKSAGSWGYNMYPSGLELVRQETPPALESVEASCSAQELAVGQTAKITAVGVMSDGYRDILKGTDVAKSFTSADTSIATVDNNGVIKALKSGTTNITAKVTINGGSKDAVIPITVNEKVLKTIDLTLAKDAIPAGITMKVSIVAKLDDGSIINLRDATVQYSSDNEQVAMVDSGGVITAVAEGTANIKADVTLGNTTVSAQARLSIVPVSLETIKVTAGKTKLFIGRQATLGVTGKLNDGQDVDMRVATVTYESSDSSVIEVGADGIATAKGVGTAQITVSVTLNGVTKSDNSISLTVESTEDVKSTKTKQTYYTPEEIAAARENIEKYDWAKAIKDGAVEAADKYVEKGELLWNMITPQSIPRAMNVNDEYKCPNCGTDLRQKYSNYPWLADPINDPWKLKCPECGIRFPSNDFGAYYNSGLNEHGIFDSAKADKSLLVNTLYPEKGEKWGVDDGFGFKDASGKIHAFIAYYNHWSLWYSDGIISKALNALRDAYIYTGDMKYARTGILLLDRIADVYPDMTLDPYGKYPNSHGGTGKGKIIGSIWETGLVQNFIKAYDAFYPAIEDLEIVSCLTNKSAKYDLDNPKNTAALIRKNIEDGIIRQVYPAVKDAKIRGNFGMHQAALAMAAVVLDSNPETSEWLDFTFQAGSLLSGPYRITGGDVMATLVDKVDRDGHGDESAPGYNMLWLGQLIEVANALDGYEGYPGADLYKNPKFTKMFSAMYPLTLAERYTAQIGDSGATGNVGLSLSINDSVLGFTKFGDPLLAQLAYFLNGNSAKGLHADIFTRDPEKVSTDIQQIINEKGKLSFESDTLAGYGFSVLRDGENYKPFSGYQIAFQDLSPFDSTASVKFFANTGTIQFEADAPGHRISYKFNVPKTDFYEVDINPFKAVSYGIYDISIDGETVATVDFYGGSGANSKLVALKKMNLTEGEHTITFVGTGRNEAATNYKMGIIHLVLFDEEALKLKEDESNFDTQRDFWMYYGRSNTSHAHRDQLNLGVHAYGLDLSPDLGYPEETGEQPHRMEWVSNTVSHNTVVVDASKQRDTYDGTPLHFDDSDMVKVMDIDSSEAYSQTEMYRRTLAMIKVDDEISYGVDFFRVKGGSDHYYSFHGAEGAVTTEGLDLVAQAAGTYAGEGVPFGQRADSVAGWGYVGSGFHWLTNVQKDTNPGSAFSVDWDIADERGVLKEPLDIHLRLTMLGDVDDVSITDGQPPKKAGNPAWLKYMIAHRKGENLNSLFTAVIEPYKDARYIQSISEVPVTINGQEAMGDVKAVKVVLTDGRTDYVVNALDNSVIYTVDGKFQFRGFLGVYSEKDGRNILSYVNDGDIIGNIVADNPGYITGTVKSFTKGLATSNELTVNLVDENVNLSKLAGKYIYIANDGAQNAVYKILGVKAQNGKEATLDLGMTTLIRKYINSSDLNGGFVYNIAEGNTFRIPLSIPLIASINSVDITTEAGIKPVLPSVVSAVYNDGTTGLVNVTWERINPLDYAKEGSFTVKGTVEGTSIQGIANIQVVTPEPATPSETPEPTPVPTPTPAPTLSDRASVKVEAIMDANGTATVEVKADVLKAAIDSAKSKVVSIEVQSVEGAKAVKLSIPAQQINEAVQRQVERIEVNTGLATISISTDTFKKNIDFASASVQLSVSKIDSSAIPESAKEKIGDNPVYDFDISVDDNKITKFSGNDVTVAISYQLKPGEKPGKVVAYYIDDSGKLEVVKNGKYNAETGEVQFKPKHFSKYTAAYNNATFNDIGSVPWANESIESLAAREVINGFGDGTFKPDDKVTRSQFIKLLMQAFDLVDPDTKCSFSDVKEGEWHYSSIASAEKLGIVNGVGNGRFDPDAEITRQDMATMAYRAANIAGAKIEATKEAKQFADSSEISVYAAKSIESMQCAGIIDGVGNGYFRPSDNSTRAEAAKVVFLLYELIK